MEAAAAGAGAAAAGGWEVNTYILSFSHFVFVVIRIIYVTRMISR